MESLVKEELRRAIDEGFSEIEVSEAKKGLLQSRHVARTQDGAVAGRLATLTYLGRTFRWDEEQDRKIAALTTRDVIDAMRRHLSLERLSRVWAGDFRSNARPDKP